MMRTQIPKFRLPESVLDEECNYILDLEPELKLGQRIDSLKALRPRTTTRSSSAAARRADAISTFPAARKRSPTSISASTGCPASRSAISTRSASASSCWAAAIPRWIAAAPRAGSAAKRSRRRALGLRGDEGLALGKRRCDGRRHPIHNFLVPKEFKHDNGKLKASCSRK
jgi:formate dehydrogenase (NADP+) beta subunit